MIRFSLLAAALAVPLGLTSCVSPDGRQGTAEVYAPLVEATAALSAKVDEVKTAIAAVADQSSRASETEQTGEVNISKTDQSSSDKWLTRLIGVGLVANLALSIWLSYPMGRARRMRRLSQEARSTPSPT